ncbi:NADH-quinone oxidoreductase subunit G [Campylobacter sp.]|uniref:NADH-quinone oxidoreductase subunit G n=1 Tax=Campylobacter sp. TaxID=205 RepID=UPI0027024B57|nr:NADH-quinone oxidoreductase subunit G [Campylobacter sp.]
MSVFIDGIHCKANESESILNIARRNGIYIPAICYLSGCSPTLACRLCMVEAEGKRVYSCNAKAKDGMAVITNSPEIVAERNAIMQTYCINHPLECGVCDKSGECELQNLTALMNVTSQNYAIKDTHKPHVKWGKISYDPALCIVCERCITVCKDKIGESALKTTPRGGDQVAKEMKDIMPKDAFAVWSKFQKSLIAPSAGANLDCSFCGECTSVCPVGALVGSEFKYGSNIWELEKIPAANPHSSDCELIYYDVKTAGIEDRRRKIYRVSNDFHFATLNPAARYGYDFANENACKNEAAFEKIVDKFKQGEVKNIIFNSFITNEEALILQNLKRKFGLNLVNSEAKRYQNFLNQFAKFSGESLYNADVASLVKTDFIISAGSFLRYDAPNVGYALNNALKINKSSAICFHTIVDEVVKSYSKNLLFVEHKAGVEAKILLWILYEFGENLDEDTKEFLSRKLIDIEVFEGEEPKIQKRLKFAAELGLDEAKITELRAKKESFTLIIGEDFIYHKEALNLAALVGMIAKFSKFKVVIVPPRTNSLGVAKICELDEPQTGFSFGYNEKADFSMSVYGGELDAPALTQQEGTFVSYDKRVVPTNAALPYLGYTLNDLANELGFKSRYTIDYTPKLAKVSEFSDVNFDDLQNYYDNGGNSHRGYLLKSVQVKDNAKFDFENLKFDEREFNVYRANPIHQFSKFTNRASQLNEAGALYASQAFLDKFSLIDNEAVKLKKEDKILAIHVKLDKNLSSCAAYLGDFDEKIDISAFFASRYANLEILKGGR